MLFDDVNSVFAVIHKMDTEREGKSIHIEYTYIHPYGYAAFPFAFVDPVITTLSRLMSPAILSAIPTP